KWKVTTVSLDGEERKPNADDKDVFIDFKGRKVILTEDGKETELFEVAALDPSTTPKILDFKGLVDMGPVIKKDTVYEGIYKLDGDDLKLALYIAAGSKRPEKFESVKD